MKPKDFEIGKPYKTTARVDACLEGNDGDCDFTNQVNLEPETRLVYDGQGIDKETLRFHSESGGIEYHLHYNDLADITAA